MVNGRFDEEDGITLFSGENCNGYSTTDTVVVRPFYLGGTWDRNNPEAEDHFHEVFSRGLSSMQFSNEGRTKITLFDGKNLSGATKTIDARDYKNTLNGEYLPKCIKLRDFSKSGDGSWND